MVESDSARFVEEESATGDLEGRVGLADMAWDHSALWDVGQLLQQTNWDG